MKTITGGDPRESALHEAHSTVTPGNDPRCDFSRACCRRGIFSHDRPAVCFIRKKKKKRGAHWPCWSTPLVKLHSLYFKVGTSVKASQTQSTQTLGNKNFNTRILTNYPARRHDHPRNVSHVPCADTASVNRLSKLSALTGLQVVALKLFGFQLKRLPLTIAFPPSHTLQDVCERNRAALLGCRQNTVFIPDVSEWCTASSVITSVHQ